MQYETASKLLRAFSHNDATRFVYRQLGNVKNRLRPGTGIADKYYFRTPALLDLLRAHDVLAQAERALEMGTGWVHWESLMLRCETDCRVTLYDVWDNRSPARLRRYLGELSDPAVRERLNLSEPRSGDLIAAALAADTLEGIYDALNFDYRVDPTGQLAGIEDGAYDLVYSSDVGEHLYRHDLDRIIARNFEILRPGGWAYHMIVISDHLRIYAQDAHPKEYLRYDPQHFLDRINPGVQYINLLQVPEFRAAFEKAGFEIVEMRRLATCDLDGFDLHESWERFDREDLETTVVQFLLRRPD